MSSKISDDQVARRAIVYIRQSTPAQVTTNLESQRRQYSLVERARELGFRDVDVIDDDLGRSGSGLAERPGFQRLVAQVCAGQVGAVFCIEASRLARNGRDWHHLVDFCGLVGAAIVDPEGIYDPRVANDRLLLGLKGTMSEFELSLFRQRSFEALRAKARRGQLQFCLPVGLCWTEDGRIELDPDRRIQESIRLVFRKFRELGSVRQVLLWMRRQKVQLPARTYGNPTRAAFWKLPVYNTLHAIITNPFYAGAYAFGRTGGRTKVVGDRARRTDGHAKPIDQWTVLIQEHHPGYISWQKFRSNQQNLADNAHMKKRLVPKAGRGGRALLSGLLRCRRCGRMLHVTYVGIGGRVVRYSCRGANINHGEATCISFGGLRADETIAHAIVEVVAPHAVQAAIEAADHATHAHTDQQRAVTLELEQAHYQARLAARRYETVDPDNRLVASELEVRWNAALTRVHELETRLSELSTRKAETAPLDRASLLALADCLPTVWNSPKTDMRLKQRIVRLLAREVIADVDDVRSEIVLTVHWHGGQHTEYRAKKNKTGQHRHRTSERAVDVVRQMAGRWPDEQIAATLNRIGLQTGSGNTWNEMRVYTLRHRLQLPNYDAAFRAAHPTLTLADAARELGASETVVRKLIQRGELQATQVAPCAPYEIQAESLRSEAVSQAVRASRRRGRLRKQRADERKTLALPGFDQPAPSDRN